MNIDIITVSPVTEVDHGEAYPVAKLALHPAENAPHLAGNSRTRLRLHICKLNIEF